MFSASTSGPAQGKLQFNLMRVAISWDGTPGIGSALNGAQDDVTRPATGPCAKDVTSLLLPLP